MTELRLGEMQAQLVLLPFVKDAHPQRRVTRSLAWASPEPEDEYNTGVLCLGFRAP